MSAHPHSEVDTRNRCHRLWYYGYILELEPIQKSVPLSRGTLGHAALESYFLAKRDLDRDPTRSDIVLKSAAYTRLLEEVNKNLEYSEVLADVQRALTYFFEADPFRNWTILEVEKVFMLKINDDLSVPIIVDLLIQDPHGDIWVVDNKFLYDFPSGVENEILPQLALYTGVCRANGINVKRAAYSILRTRNLRNPTTDTMYKFEPVNLTDMRVFRNFQEHAIVAEMCHNDKKNKTPEQISWEAVRIKQPKICNMCWASGLCLAELNDQQPELVYNTFYKHRNPYGRYKGALDAVS